MSKNFKITKTEEINFTLNSPLPVGKQIRLCIGTAEQFKAMDEIFLHGEWMVIGHNRDQATADAFRQIEMYDIKSKETG